MTVQANFNGQIITEPGSLSQVDATDLNNQVLGYSGILAIVGECAGGQPKTILEFTSSGSLKDTLRSGAAYDAARVAFAPTTQVIEGNVPRPQKVYVVRVTPATQSTMTVVDGVSANSITFTSADYGLHTNQIALKQENGTTGKKVTVTFETATEVFDNLGADNIFTLVYSGNASTATVSVTSTGITTTLAGDQSDGSTDQAVLFSSYATITQICDFFNAQTGYTAVAVTPVAFNGVNLDYVTAQSIKTSAYGLKAILYSIVTAINSGSSLVTAARATPGNLVPANFAKTYMTGGGVGTTATSDWQAAVDVLKTRRVNFVVMANSTSGTFAALADIFKAFAADMQGKNECHVHFGAPPSETLANLQTFRTAINSTNCNLWFQSPTLYSDSGVSTLYEPYMYAALMAGIQSGAPVGTSFVGKIADVLDLTQNTNIDLYDDATTLIISRLSFARFKDGIGFEVVRALTTYSLDDNDYNTESGIRSAVNYAVYELRTDIDTKFKGRRTLWNNAGSTADSARNELLSFARILEDASVIIKGSRLVNGVKTILPAIVVDNVSISGDIMRLRYGIRPIGAINFIFHEIVLKKVEQVA